MYERMKAFQILKDAGIYIASDNVWNEITRTYTQIGTPAKWLSSVGGEHQIIVAGNYYSVDLVLGTWTQTA